MLDSDNFREIDINRIQLFRMPGLDDSQLFRVPCFGGVAAVHQLVFDAADVVR